MGALLGSLVHAAADVLFVAAVVVPVLIWATARGLSRSGAGPVPERDLNAGMLVCVGVLLAVWGGLLLVLERLL